MSFIGQIYFVFRKTFLPLQYSMGVWIEIKSMSDRDEFRMAQFDDYLQTLYLIIENLKMKNLSGKTMIFYTFQEPSSSKQPQFNVTTFKKSSPTQIKIRDVLFQLPLNYEQNSYHLRFKSEFFEGEDKVIGWIDISNLLAKVPIINNAIFVKILKLKEHKHNKLFSVDKLKAVGLVDPVGQKPTQNGRKPKPQTNLFDLDPIGSVPKTQTHQVPSNNFQMPLEPPKKKFVPETQQEMADAFVQQCKEQERDRDNQRIAARELEEKIKEWGYSGHATINNITTLLATLHTIWPEWQQVSLSDMLKPEDIQALFKKAVIKVHPDKNRKKDFRKRYLAKRVFELLNDAKIAHKNN